MTSIVFTPGARARAQEVRPDLGLHHDEQPRPHEPQRAVDDEAEVERKVEHLVDVLKVVARDLLARHGRRRQEEPQLRVALAERREQGARGEHLADRHRVNPDRFVGVEIERHGQVAEPLRQVRDVLPVAHRLVDQVRRHHGEKRHHDHAVDHVHVPIRNTLVRRLTGAQAVQYNHLFDRRRIVLRFTGWRN